MNIDHNKVQISEAFGLEKIRMEFIINQTMDWVDEHDPKDTEIMEYGLSLCYNRTEELCIMYFLGAIREKAVLEFSAN